MEKMIMDRYGIVFEDYRLMEIMVLKGAPHYAGKQWKFAGAFYYATTVLTTIGVYHCSIILRLVVTITDRGLSRLQTKVLIDADIHLIGWKQK